MSETRKSQAHSQSDNTFKRGISAKSRSQNQTTKQKRRRKRYERMKLFCARVCVLLFRNIIKCYERGHFKY